MYPGRKPPLMGRDTFFDGEGTVQNKMFFFDSLFNVEH